MENKLLTPLHFAAWFNSTEAVECLIQKGAYVESSSAFGQKPLHYAAGRASIELVKVSMVLLIKHGTGKLRGVSYWTRNYELYTTQVSLYSHICK